MSYKFREDIAMADAAVEIKCKKLEDVFREAAEATTDIMVNRKTLKAKKVRKVALKNADLEQLLLKWLEEIVFIKDAHNFLGKNFRVKIKENKKTKEFELEGKINGEEVDQKRHEIRTDVKAVTMHMFSLKKEKSGWEALVILDT
jgi:SHS2 domain-containing protein